MKVRKGQNSISFKYKAHAIAEVKWLSKNGIYRATLEQIPFLSWEDVLNSRVIDDEIQFVTYHAEQLIFHPPAPCAGEIIVRYTTIHQI